MALNDRLGGSLRTFCALIPVDDVEALRAELEGWTESPFARLPSTHFARFVVVPELRRDVAGQPDDPLGSPYLMFSAFFDGEPDAYLASLCDVMPDEAYAVLRHCRDCPGDLRSTAATVRRWLMSHRVPATAIFGAYADASVQEVRDALAFREAFRALVWDVEARRDTHARFAAFAEEHRRA